MSELDSIVYVDPNDSNHIFVLFPAVEYGMSWDDAQRLRDALNRALEVRSNPKGDSP